MRAFLFVVAFILILFGVSFWYFRSAPEGGGLSFLGLKLPLVRNITESETGGGGPSVTPAKESGEVLSSTAEKYRSLEIVAGTSDRLSVGQSRVFFAVGKTESGGSVSVPGSWSLSNSTLGTLESGSGVETTFKAVKEGRVKLLLIYQNLKAEKEVTVSGVVLGTTVSPTVTPAGTGSAPVTATEVKAIGVNIYDADGRRLVVGDSRNFKARVLFSDGREKDLEVAWSLLGDLGNLSRTQGLTTDFKALKMGQGTLTATYQNVSAQLSLRVN